MPGYWPNTHFLKPYNEVIYCNQKEKLYQKQCQ